MPRIRAVLPCALWLRCLAEERIIAATYGIAGCMGVRDATDWAALTALGCNVVTTRTAHGPRNATSARSASSLKFACGLFSDIENADGLPVTFSSPVDASTLDAEDFKITLSNGSWVQPLCVTTAPANEGNEGNTVATIGYYGDGVAGQVYPVKVTIVGRLDLITEYGAAVSAEGLEFNDTTDLMYMNPDSHPRMVQARVERFSTIGEQFIDIDDPLLGRFPNHCRHLYGSNVTHRIRVVLSGGATLDGVTSFLPDTPDVFQVLLSNGSTLAAPHMLGIADLGSERGDGAALVHDGDNFFDLCLADAREELVESISRVRMPCSGTKLYYPRGAKHWRGCTDHSIDVERRIEGGATYV